MRPRGPPSLRGVVGTDAFKPVSLPAGRVRWHAYLLIAALAGLALLPGCVDDAFEDGQAPEDGEDEDTYETCDALVVPFEANGTEWQAARIECEANVTGTDAQPLSCSEPEEARLVASTNLTAGQVELRVDDGEGERVAIHRLSDTGEEARELSLERGAPGEWTLTGERLESFEGTYTAELACPQ